MKSVSTAPGTARDEIRTALLDRQTLVRAIFSDPGKAPGHGWRKILVRPLELKAGPRWQVSRFDARKDITKNYDEREIRPVLDELLGLGFRSVQYEGTLRSVSWTRTSKGAFLMSVREPAVPSGQVGDHDRKKRTVLDVESPPQFLEMLGFLTPEGSLKASKRDKFTQINEFLRILDETKAVPSQGKSFSVVDFGCGNAYLTFALYHRLVNDLGVEAEVTGVDLKEDLILAHRERVLALGWSGLRFEAGTIQSYTVENPPDAIVALHACDTATDDAISQGLAWGSSLIIAAPCCHHNLQTQLAGKATPPAFSAVFRHGLTAERQADLLTDVFRALILRIKGYKTDIIQFVDPSHTPKNLMIRAVKTSVPAPASFLEEYRAMKDFWGVTPYLETKLGPIV